MRKYILFTAAVLLFAGCSDEDDHKVTPVPEPDVDTVTILATNEVITFDSNESYTPEWQTGDQIIVDYGGNSYVYEAYSDGVTAEFYPVAMSLPTDAGGSITAWANAPNGVFSVDVYQNDVVMPRYAHSSSASVSGGSLSLSFKPLVSVLALTISEPDETSKVVSTIILETTTSEETAECLAATEIVADPETGEIKVSEDAKLSTTISKNVDELSLTSDQTVYFYLTPGVTLSGGLRVSIYCTDASKFEVRVFDDAPVEFSTRGIAASTSLHYTSAMTISSYEEMLSFAEDCANGNGPTEVELTADIDMQNVAWTPITGFSGAFNGNGHYIYNLNVSDGENQYVGFFGSTDGTISDVMFGTKDGKTYDGSSKIEVMHTTISADYTFGGVIARVMNSVTNVTSFIPVTITANTPVLVGGITGNLHNASLTGCSSYGDVTNSMTTSGANCFIAGVVGSISGEVMTTATVEDCHNYGTVVSTYAVADIAVGGVVGRVSDTSYYPVISNCTNEGEVHINNSTGSFVHNVGGVVAYITKSATLTVKNCTNTAKVHSNMNGNCFMGGVAGYDYTATFDTCENSGEVYFEQSNSSGSGYVSLGGVVGQTYSSSEIRNCTNTGSVHSDKLQVSRVGGIVGTHNASSIINCVNYGDITLTIPSAANNWESIGGIAGFYDGTDGKASAQGCTNYGKVTGSVYSTNANIGAGGVVGIIKSGDAIDSVNYGDISMYNASSGQAAYAGGICGYDYNAEPANVTGCTNNGSAEASAAGSSSSIAAGGVLGRNDYATVSGCANYGTATCTLYAGSLIGWNEHPLSNSVAGGTVNGVAVTESNYSDYAVGYTTGSGSSSGITFGTSN